MAENQPGPITAKQRRARRQRCRRVADRVGFVGRVEYRHVFSSSGGAQYGIGRTPAEDLLLVYAEAFVRDADPEDFSLEAILAHERGHQILYRHSRLARLMAIRISPPTEEILASLLGSLVVEAPVDQGALISKAVFEAIQCRIQPDDAARLVSRLRGDLEPLL